MRSQMTASTPTIPPAEALRIHSLITPTEQGIASRVLAKSAGGNLTLFAFDSGQGLPEHTCTVRRSSWFSTAPSP